MNENISVIILMKNAAPYLEDLIPVLSRQKYVRIGELVVIDSGSTDGSVERLVSLCERHGLKLNFSSIPPHEFGHGRTRNLAVKRASSDLVAMLSQDALPTSDTWLHDLVRLLDDEKVAGACGRPVPREGTELCEAIFYRLSYTAERRHIVASQISSFSNLNGLFGNVTSVVRRLLILENPFRDDLIMGEDQYWGRAMLEQGYSLIYEPSIEVLHSHNYTLRQLFKRFLRSGYSMRQIKLEGNVLQDGTKTTFAILKEVLLTRPGYFPYALLYLGVQGAAFLCGKFNLLPGPLRDRLLGVG